MLTLAEDGSTSQMRFLALTAVGGEGKSLEPEETATKWTIPVKVVWDNAELVVMLAEGGDGEGDRKLKEKLQELTTAGKWFKVNAGQLGFFKVNYTKQGWENLSRYIFEVLRRRVVRYP